MCACVRACVCMYVHVCVRVYVYMCVCVSTSHDGLLDDVCFYVCTYTSPYTSSWDECVLQKLHIEQYLVH